jgi:hypothetical protein
LETRAWPVTVTSTTRIAAATAENTVRRCCSWFLSGSHHLSEPLDRPGGPSQSDEHLHGCDPSVADQLWGVCTIPISAVSDPDTIIVAEIKSAAANHDIVRELVLDIDRTLLREDLNLSFEDRVRKHLRVLQFVEELIDGIAAILHGSARVAFDVNVVYSRNDNNIERLANSLAPYNPCLREASPGPPFAWDAKQFATA